jgi:hypothetical protein
MSPFLRSCDLDLDTPITAADSVSLLDVGRIGGCGADHRRHGERHRIDALAERSTRQKCHRNKTGQKDLAHADLLEIETNKSISG